MVDPAIWSHARCTVLGNGSGHGPTVLMTLSKPSAASSVGDENVRAQIFFNVGEGCQRVCDEYAVRLRGTCPIFAAMMTRANGLEAEKYAGGVPGLFMALADRGAARLSVRGPLGTTARAKAWQKFARRRFPVLDVLDVESPARLERLADDTIQILSPRITSSDNALCDESGYCHWCAIDNAVSESDEDYDEEEDETEDEEDETEDEEDEEEEETDDEYNPASILAYITRLRPPGSSSSACILFVDCPDEQWISCVANNPHLQFSCCNAAHKPSIVYHLAPRNICESVKYQAWVSKLQSRDIAEHVFVSEPALKIERVFKTSDNMRRMLGTVSPSLFPIDDKDTDSKEVTKRGKPSVSGAGLMETKTIVGEDAEAAIRRRANNLRRDEDDMLAEAVKRVRIREGCSVDRPLPREAWQREASLVFLGTGSAKPSKLRGCSSIYLRLPTPELPQMGAMLDAGEGTFGQLSRMYGREQAERLVGGLRFVWISHHHLDHHGGLMRILEMWRRNNEGRTGALLTIVGPHSVREALVTARALTHHVRCFHVSRIHEAVELAKRSQPGFGRIVKQMRTKHVHHCHDAHAVALDLSLDATRSLCLLYSGDTRPCGARLRHLFDSCCISGAERLLIHDATFGPSLVEQAVT